MTLPAVGTSSSPEGTGLRLSDSVCGVRFANVDLLVGGGRSCVGFVVRASTCLRS